MTAVALGMWSGPTAGQVILNEVLADPEGSEHHEEFVELHNTSPDSVDLYGWQIGDADELDAIIDAGWGTRVGPGEFAVVVDASYFGNSAVYDSVHAWARIVTIEDRSFGRAGWSNSAPELIVLRDPGRVDVDSLRYDPLEGIPGHSWERRGAQMAAVVPRRRHTGADQQRRAVRGS